MATGDLKGNLDRLLLEASKVHFKGELDPDGLRVGDPATLLPLLHHILLGYSPRLARHLAESPAYALATKTDRKFIDGALRFVRELGYRPGLTTEQFLSPGFAERKLILVTDIARLCRQLETSPSAFLGEGAADDYQPLPPAAAAQLPPPSASNRRRSSKMMMMMKSRQQQQQQGPAMSRVETINPASALVSRGSRNVTVVRHSPTAEEEGLVEQSAPQQREQQQQENYEDQPMPMPMPMPSQIPMPELPPPQEQQQPAIIMSAEPRMAAAQLRKKADAKAANQERSAIVTMLIEGLKTAVDSLIERMERVEAREKERDEEAKKAKEENEQQKRANDEMVGVMNGLLQRIEGLEQRIQQQQQQLNELSSASASNSAPSAPTTTKSRQQQPQQQQQEQQVQLTQERKTRATAGQKQASAEPSIDDTEAFIQNFAKRWKNTRDILAAHAPEANEEDK